ncbi:lipopolysaccharide biosynthesis protein [uncultured Alistipes sp.]|uniref:lipopolysaccharide biosynthesis protein n=1 Tax=uncultured Alistipes sp. TaxID=538949 RepID=UPI0025F1FA5D|nr:lipopolysaccharide biosynthesis protein [uncultured Alistipes sp.]
MNNFKRDFISGVTYTAIAKYSGIFVSIIITSILARLIAPADFGVIAIATVIIMFINLLTDLGFGPAIIQNDELDETDISSLFTFTILIGIIVAALFIVCAHPISRFYDNEILTPVIYWLSINIFFAAINIVPNALLLKNKAFKLISIRTLSFQIGAGVVAITGAFSGLGIYALVLQAIVYCIGIFAFNYYKFPIKISKISYCALSKVIGFSTFQFLSNVIVYFTKNLDKLVVGKYFNLAQLGYYEKSYRLMLMPVENISYVFGPVMQPVFKDISSNIQILYDKYKKLLRVISLISFPLSMYLFFAAQDLIYVFYGNNWIPAIMPFRLLSASVGFLILLATTGPLYQVTNNVRIMFLVCLIEGIWSLIALTTGITLGSLNYVATCISIGIVARFLSSFSIIYIKIFKLPFITIFKDISNGIALGALMGSILYLLHLCFHTQFSLLRLALDSICIFILITSVFYKMRLLNLKN